MIDLLGETPSTQDGNGSDNKEEQKEQTQKPTTEKHHYLDDLLSMDFSPAINKETPSGTGSNFAQPQQNNQLNFLGSMTQPIGGVQFPYNQFNPVYPQGLIQPNFGQTIPLNFPSGYNTLRQHPVNQPINNNGLHESLSPISPSKVEEQAQNQPQTKYLLITSIFFLIIN